MSLTLFFMIAITALISFSLAWWLSRQTFQQAKAQLELRLEQNINSLQALENLKAERQQLGAQLQEQKSNTAG